MKIAILGYAGQGQSSYDYWNTGEHEITICDKNIELSIPEGATSQLGDGYLSNLDGFDLLVRTPAMHPREILAANPESPRILEKVTSNTNEFFRVCPTKNIIGVTGTKGKGTTSTLITKMLEAAGKRVHLGGNIGTPPLDMLHNNIQPDDWVVLELANFQLIDLKYSPGIAVCLMVVPEHLDWHEDLEEYIAAKQQLFIHQTEKDTAIYYAKNENSISIADASVGKQLPYYERPGAIVENDLIKIDEQEICRTDELRLLGQHNWQNACAATTAVWQIIQDIPALRSALLSFSGLPFRIEYRTTVNGIRYYNDSFATGPGATMAAIKAIPGQKVMIIGGYDRGLDLDELAQTLSDAAQDIRKVILVGASAERTSGALQKANFTAYEICAAKTMDEIVAMATAAAEDGDAVVLSPSFASFDMFKNFEDRGIKFNEAVAKL